MAGSSRFGGGSGDLGTGGVSDIAWLAEEILATEQHLANLLATYEALVQASGASPLPGT